jgi:large subunit ribosomal protein L17
MANVELGDTVRVTMPKGFNKRGVHGISVMYTTWPEARFEGAVGRVVEVRPRGTHGIPLYLVDFRGVDQGRLAIPWQSEWFRETWLAVEGRGGGGGDRSPATAAASAPPNEPGLAVRQEPARSAGSRTTVREESQSDPTVVAGVPGSTAEAVPQASGMAAAPGVTSAGTPEVATGAESPKDHQVEGVPPGAVPAGGKRECPDGYPIKGNAGSMRYHLPGQPSYARTAPELCFATEEAARAAGFAPVSGRRKR